MCSFGLDIRYWATRSQWLPGTPFYGFGLFFLFVWVLDVCWLWGFCRVLLGVLSLSGRFFSVFLRAWVFGFLCLILGQLLSHETQESISVVWCKMTPL